MKLTEEEKERINRFVMIEKCPHCGNNHMHLMDESFHLISANKNPKFEIDSAFPIAVYFCPKCSYMMMFNIGIIKGL